MDLYVVLQVVLWIVTIAGILLAVAVSYSASNDIRKRRAKKEPLPSRMKIAREIIIASVSFIAAVAAMLILAR